MVSESVVGERLVEAAQPRGRKVRFCAVPDCEREARPGRSMCSMHASRAERRTCLQAPVVERRSSWSRFTDAVLAYANVDSEDDRAFEAARKRLASAAMDWAEGILERRRGGGRQQEDGVGRQPGGAAPTAREASTPAQGAA
jgi:hypothetical protein